MILGRALTVLALLCGAQIVLSANEDFSEFSPQISGILRNFQSNVNGIRRTGDSLNETLDKAEPLAIEKVNKEYRNRVSRYWSQNLDEAKSAANEKCVNVAECTSDNFINDTLDKVVKEAEKKVREKIPRLVPGVRDDIKDLNLSCDAFMEKAKEKGRVCDSMDNYFSRSMCMATRLATLGGHIGGLGGQAGGIGGKVAGVIDGTAREAVISCAQDYDVAVKAYVAKATNCIYSKL